MRECDSLTRKTHCWLRWAPEVDGANLYFSALGGPNQERLEKVMRSFRQGNDTHPSKLTFSPNGMEATERRKGYLARYLRPATSKDGWRFIPYCRSTDMPGFHSSSWVSRLLLGSWRPILTRKGRQTQAVPRLQVGRSSSCIVCAGCTAHIQLLDACPGRGLTKYMAPWSFSNSIPNRDARRWAVPTSGWRPPNRPQRSLSPVPATALKSQLPYVLLQIALSTVLDDIRPAFFRRTSGEGNRAGKRIFGICSCTYTVRMTY